MAPSFAELSSVTDMARDKAQQHATAATKAARKEPPVCPTDDEAVTPQSQTRSWDYIWRSGVAGGLAGCAVSARRNAFDARKLPPTAC